MLVRKLQDHFQTNLDTDGLRPVLILDEAHELRVEVLGMIRLVTNFEMVSRLVLSVVLAGQPKLGAMLRRQDSFDGVAQLIALSFEAADGGDDSVDEGNLTAPGSSISTSGIPRQAPLDR